MQTMTRPPPPTPLPPSLPQTPPPLPQVSFPLSITRHLIINDALLNDQDTLNKAAQDIPPVPTAPKKHTKYVYVACELMTGRVQSDQTGDFPITSISGKKCIFLLYDDDDNYIDDVTILSRTQQQILKAYK